MTPAQRQAILAIAPRLRFPVVKVLWDDPLVEHRVEQILREARDRDRTMIRLPCGYELEWKPLPSFRVKRGRGGRGGRRRRRCTVEPRLTPLMAHRHERAGVKS